MASSDFWVRATGDSEYVLLHQNELYRKKLLQDIKISINELIGASVGAEGAVTDAVNGVNELCFQLEAVLVHCLQGDKNSSNYARNLVSFWDYVLAVTRSGAPFLERVKKEIERLPDVHTLDGKGRAFIRCVLNAGRSSAVFKAFISDKSVEKWYTKSALLRSDEEASMLVSLLSALSTVRFDLTLNEPNLDVRMQHDQPGSQARYSQAMPVAEPPSGKKRRRKKKVTIVEIGDASGSASQPLVPAVKRKEESHDYKSLLAEVLEDSLPVKAQEGAAPKPEWVELERQRLEEEGKERRRKEEEEVRAQQLALREIEERSRQEVLAKRREEEEAQMRLLELQMEEERRQEALRQDELQRKVDRAAERKRMRDEEEKSLLQEQQLQEEMSRGDRVAALQQQEEELQRSLQREEQLKILAKEEESRLAKGKEETAAILSKGFEWPEDTDDKDELHSAEETFSEEEHHSDSLEEDELDRLLAQANELTSSKASLALPIKQIVIDADTSSEEEIPAEEAALAEVMRSLQETSFIEDMDIQTLTDGNPYNSRLRGVRQSGRSDNQESGGKYGAVVRVPPDHIDFFLLAVSLDKTPLAVPTNVDLATHIVSPLYDRDRSPPEYEEITAHGHIIRTERRGTVLDLVPPDSSSIMDENLWLIIKRQIPLQLMPKGTLKAQRNKCPGCDQEISQGYFAAPRFCSFYRMFFCDKCHNNQMVVVPAYVFRKWDFTLRKVSKPAARLLEALYHQPVYHIADANPHLIESVPALRNATILRQQLFFAKDYLLSCNRDRVNLLRTLSDADRHLVYEPLLYSMRDLVCIFRGELLQMIRALTKKCISHITACLLCGAKGYVCQFCRAPEYIFPFQLKSVAQCKGCDNFCHRRCYNPSECPTCSQRLMNHTKAYSHVDS